MAELSRGLSRRLNRRRLVVLVAAVLAAALTARLGLWQVDRGRQKADLQDQISARSAMPALPQAELARDPVAAEVQHYRRIQLRGRWLADRTVYLDNRAMNGRAGFIVVTPLLLDSGSPGDAVLVQRGWSPRHQTDRTQLAALATPQGEVELSGRIAPPPSKLYEFDAAGGGVIRQNLDLTHFAREIRVPLRPLSVQQTGAVGADVGTAAGTAPSDGLLRDWPAPALDVAKHHGYAFQWFALCALICGLYAWFELIAPWRRRSF